MTGSRLISTLVPVVGRAAEVAAASPTTAALAAGVAYAVARWRAT